jgi:transcriptional/translational regulatory protein YebC/TACO1
MFHRKGIIFIDPKKYAYEAVEEFTFETAAEDIISDDNYIKIVTSLEDFHDVEKAFEDKNIELMESKIDYIADNEVALDDFDKALQFKKMVEALEADEDVSQVSTNEILSEELSAEVDAFIEKNTFRS